MEGVTMGGAGRDTTKKGGSGRLDVRVVNEIPANLRKLALLLVKTFYGEHHFLVMNILAKNLCMCEEKMRVMLYLDKKRLREVLMQLKREKFIKDRLMQDTRPSGGRTFKNVYYCINYCAITNTAKYKIDKMRKRLEQNDKPRPVDEEAFLCRTCKLTYTALEMTKIFDPHLGKMICWRCGTELEEKWEIRNGMRNSVARFNEQMRGIFELIASLDGVQLAPHLLRPVIVSGIPPEQGVSHTSEITMAERALQPCSSVAFSIEPPPVDDSLVQVDIIGGSSSPKRAMKELPAWLQKGPLVLEDDEPSVSGIDRLTANGSNDCRQASGGAFASEHPNVKVEHRGNLDAKVLCLLEEERNEAEMVISDAVGVLESVNSTMSASSGGSEEENEEENEEEDGEKKEVEEEEEDEDPTVLVAGEPTPLDDITTEHLLRMLPEEREMFQRVTRDLYGF